MVLTKTKFDIKFINCDPSKWNSKEIEKTLNDKEQVSANFEDGSLWMKILDLIL